jgi:hypothetical protein
MFETDIMEELSRGYIEAIANRSGFFSLNGKDYGSDLHMCQAQAEVRPNRKKAGTKRYMNTGQQVHIQLKSTCEKDAKLVKGNIEYRLRTDNYNDLVSRAQKGGRTIPLILVLFVFPDDRSQWLDIKPTELTFRRCAYWYEVDPKASMHDKEKIKISIPEKNIIGPSFFSDIFTYFA